LQTALGVSEPVVPEKSITVEKVDNTLDIPDNAAAQPVSGLDDDDWLRSRTSRLLDLVDPDEIPIPTAPISMDGPAIVQEEASALDLDPPQEADLEKENEAETLDPEIEKIRVNGRLFVRNLPYSATEDDLRKHFESYGNLEEVRVHSHRFDLLFCDEYPDRDSLCSRACDVNWTKILVDASCFLKTYCQNSLLLIFGSADN
jgi:hypothetical protein